MTVRRGDKVEAIKQEVSKAMHLSARSIFLIFGDEEMADSRTLASYSLLADTLLIADVRQVTINLTVILPAGPTVAITAIDDWSVTTLKEKIMEKASVLRSANFKLYAADEEMEDSELVGKKANDRDSLQAVIVMKGGSK